ncbi:hypothetical protein WG66_000436 [Moniliophthora roreri]|uniref:DUF3835 domain-containing protein n=1 Tax=Moniliophthora roreri TaxID=221103 RepID=A0A0W0GDD5_MONRR|nr:hypothetical protein WG66_000436 [Moniliophthora roreri]
MSSTGRTDAEGLQNLLQSIAPDAVQNVTPEALQRLSDKLSELMGEDVVRTAFAGGEQFNEHGLSILDVTEPSSLNANGSTSVASMVEEPPLIPLSSLSSSERERHRRERDRILDLLEEEEEIEQRRADELEREERRREMERRKEAARTELDKLKMIKESHKKMGKALLQSLEESRKEDQVPDVKREKSDTSKKSVSFADEHEPAVDVSSPTLGSTPHPSEVDWGDLLRGKLRASGRPTLLSTNDEHLMKKQVVERIPGTTQQRSTPKQPIRSTIDSDDESEPAHSPPFSDSEDEDGNPELEEDEFDIDTALHHREIALAYQAQRSKIGEDTAQALASHMHDPKEDPSLDQSHKPKASVSKFRAGRLASSYAASSPSTSQSIGASTIPASGVDTLQRAIRMGKLDSDEHLVGGADEGESDQDEGHEAVQEVLELLKKGEVYNLGPGGLHAITPEGASSSKQPPPFTMPYEPLPTKPKTSKFKLSRDPPSSIASSSDPSTPINTSERSSPKLPNPSAVIEHAAPLGTSAPSFNPTVVASPSFTRPGQSTSGPMIVESPSFPSGLAPRSVTRPERPPMVMSSTVKEKETTQQLPMVLESPSFPSGLAPRSSSRPERPPAVMASTVREKESGRNVTQPQSEEASEQPKRVSRFKAEHM